MYVYIYLFDMYIYNTLYRKYNKKMHTVITILQALLILLFFVAFDKIHHIAV